MLGHGAHMARGPPGGDHRGIAKRGTAFQIDGDDILGLVVIQRSQDALQQIALRRGLPGGRLGTDGLLGLCLFGFLCRDLFGGLGGGFLAGGLLGSFTSQGGGPLRSRRQV
jgi:hypothetical protein